MEAGRALLRWAGAGVMAADVATFVSLVLFAAGGWFVGYWRGHETADALWRRRFREQKSLLLDALRRVAAFEEAARDRHERCPLTPAEHESFQRIAEREES